MIGVPVKFNNDLFDYLEILGQVDKKFIAAMAPSDDVNQGANLFILFDQHAVHERIRLESLLAGG